MMSFEKELNMLKHLLNDDATLKPLLDRNEYDFPTFDVAKNIKCKFEFAVKKEKNSSSSSNFYPARMFCYESVSVGDIVSYNSQNFKVIQVDNYKDLDGNSILNEVYLQ